MTPEDIKKKIEELESQRLALIAQANQQIGIIIGQIEAWKQLLASLTATEKADGAGT